MQAPGLTAFLQNVKLADVFVLFCINREILQPISVTSENRCSKLHECTIRRLIDNLQRNHLNKICFRDLIIPLLVSVARWHSAR